MNIVGRSSEGRILIVYVWSGSLIQQIYRRASDVQYNMREAVIPAQLPAVQASLSLADRDKQHNVRKIDARVHSWSNDASESSTCVQRYPNSPSVTLWPFGASEIRAQCDPPARPEDSLWQSSLLHSLVNNLVKLPLARIPHEAAYGQFS